jgi:hypothetical protein
MMFDRSKKIRYSSFNSFVYSVLNYNDHTKDKDNNGQYNPMKRYFIFYIILYIWMIRMAISVVGLLGPIGYSFIRKINPIDIEHNSSNLDTK